MPLRFDSDPRPETFQVLQFALDAPIFIIAGADASFQRRTALHWLPDQKRAVPCTHEDCPWCPTPIRMATYLPALAYSTSLRVWKQKVLPLTESMEEFLTVQHVGKIFEFVRRGRKNAPVRWSQCEHLPKPQPFAGFDVLPSLLKVWGMYASAKRTKARPDADAFRLFNDDDELAGV